VAALLSGECDIVDQTSNLDEQAEFLLELKAAGQINATFVTGTMWEHADFGIAPAEDYARPDFFGDLRTRQAIAHCMDRQAVVDSALYGQSVVPDTFVPPSHPLFNADAPRYEFDVARGAQLLDEVGWIDDDADPSTPRVALGIQGVDDGTPLEFNYWTTNSMQRQLVSQVLQDSLAQCGVKINLEYWNDGLFDDGPQGPIFGRRFDMAQFAFDSGVEPPCWYFLSSSVPGSPEEGYCGWSCPGASGWSDPEYDQVCSAAMQALPGTPDYEQYHQEAQRIWAENLPLVPLYVRLKLAATRADMQGFVMDATQESEMWNIEEFDY
jgi:peptide/nickel transport system substrate-binding protein